MMFIIDGIKNYFKKFGANSKHNFKKIVLAAPFWVLLAAIVMLATGSIRAAILVSDRYDSRMEEVWGQSGGDDYRHVRVYASGSRPAGSSEPARYIDGETSLKRTDIADVRKALQSAADTLNESSAKRGLNSDGTPNNWEDCWSTFMKSEAATVPESGSNAAPYVTACDVVGVGGNFAAFHPFMYMSGGFLPEICTDPNQVVINDVLAWRFFSSYDVVGFKISLWGNQYTVAGVVSEPGSSIDNDAGTDEPRVYMYFSTIENYFANDQLEDVAIQCYEAFLPEAVKGVAVNDMIAALPNYSSDDPKMLVVDVTGRFFFTKVWDFMVPLGENELPEGVEIPYWEKAARITTEHLFVDMILIILGTLLLIVGIIMLVLKIRKFTAEQVREEEIDPDEAEGEVPGLPASSET